MVQDPVIKAQKRNMVLKGRRGKREGVTNKIEQRHGNRGEERELVTGKKRRR